MKAEERINRLKLIIDNTVSFFGSLLLNRLLNFLVSIWLVRYLGPVQLGQYSFVLAFVSLFALFCDLSIGQLVICQVSKDHSLANRYLGSYLIIQFLISLTVLSIMLGVISNLHYSQLIRLALYIAGINLFASSLSAPFYNLIIAFEKLRFNALMSVISNIFYCLLILSTIYFRKGILVLISATLLTSILEFIMNVLVCLRIGVWPDFRFDKKIWQILLKYIGPFAFYLIFTGLYRRIDVVVLQYLQGDTAVGFYSAAYKIIFLFLLLPASFIKAIFPLLSEQASRDREKLAQTLLWSMKHLVALGLPIAISCAFFSGQIIELLFGPAFLNSSLILSILGWSLVFSFWNHILSNSLVAAVKMFEVISGTIAVFILNLFLNLILIPKFSYIGSAYSIMISELLAGVWFYIAIRKSISFKHPLVELFKIIIATLAMVILLWFLRGFNLFIAMGLGLIIYTSVLLSLKFISPAEKILLKEVVRIKNFKPCQKD
ncbi:MAG: flippase [Candidatus Omnitrophota bacterium]